MEHQYGIAVSNKFDLFVDEDEDPYEILKQQEEAKQKKTEETKSKSSKNKQTSKKSAPVTEAKSKQNEQIVPKKEDKPQSRQNERVRSGRPNREPREIRENDGERRPPRRMGVREHREPRGDENVPPEFRERPEGSGGFRSSGEGGERGRGRGRGRGGRGGRGRGGFSGPSGERPRREFDRHSGSDRTGIKPVEKKEGGGAHNWGTFKDEIDDQMREPSEQETSREENVENPDLNESGEAETVPEEEKQPKEMTLDEWKALQRQSRAKQEFNLRKAGEGVDNSQWKKGVAYKKKVEEEDEEDEEDDEDDEDDEKGHHNKNRLNITITFNEPARRGRGSRRSRGGGGRGTRAGSGRGGGPNGERKSRETAPRVDDENDFPRLVKTEA